MLFNQVILGLLVQSHMAGHISAELSNMTALAHRIIAGEELDITESFSIEKSEILVLSHACKEYVLTIEDGDNLRLFLRSTDIPELIIGLPTPVYVSMGSPLVLEEYC